MRQSTPTSYEETYNFYKSKLTGKNFSPKKWYDKLAIFLTHYLLFKPCVKLG